VSVYEAMARSHPKLIAGQVWCRSCGRTTMTDAAWALQHGWPKCCGYTMTLDAPTGQP
jgi:hypothetical protein